MASLRRSTPPPIVTLTTDFGRRDGYVGAMVGVILSICPGATVVHISHDIPPQDVRAAAFVLYQAFSYYPPYTVHCVVVDPGVGSQRRAIAVRTSHGLFIGPDNGVFSLVLTARQINVMEAVTLSNPAYHLSHVSSTFHGRDIFAPAAAYLASGIGLEEIGVRAINPVKLDFGHRAAAAEGPVKECRVIHVDHFGNLILDLTAQDLGEAREVTFVVGNQTIDSLSYTFADVDEGQLLAYIGSSRDHIEIAVRNGSAARQLGLGVGSKVIVTMG